MAINDGGTNFIQAGAGDDVIYGIGGLKNTIYGGDGNDSITAGDSGDVLYGENGTDLILGGLGNDIISGGAGTDSLLGGGGNDLIWGGQAGVIASTSTEYTYTSLSALIYSAGLPKYRISDNLALMPDGAFTLFLDSFDGLASDGDDRIGGGPGNDLLIGGGGKNIIEGDDGNDYLDGGADLDETSGGAGLDVVRGGANDDILHGNSDIDQLYGDDGSDTLFADGGDVSNNQTGQRLFGGRDNDFLYAWAPSSASDNSTGDESYGGPGDDWLYGNVRNDRLSGDDGNDFIHGDFLAGNQYATNLFAATLGGTDTLDGGSGEDLIYGGGSADTLLGGTGSDRLEGQDGDDTIFAMEESMSSSPTSTPVMDAWVAIFSAAICETAMMILQPTFSWFRGLKTTTPSR